MTPLHWLTVVLGLTVAGETIYIYASRQGDDAAETVEATADVAHEVGDAANAERLAELGVARALAEAPLARIVCEEAVRVEGKTERVVRLQVALCSDLAALQAMQSGIEKSAGLNIEERQKAVELAGDALVAEEED